MTEKLSDHDKAIMGQILAALDARKQKKIKILSIRIGKVPDESPDTSCIGEYTDKQENWVICRCCGEYLMCLPEDHIMPERGREFRFFKPYAGGEKEGTKEYCKYGKQDFARMEGLNRGDWHFMGIIAKANVQLSKDSPIQQIRSGGLWGIESDSGEKYLKEIEQEQLAELKKELEACGFGERAIEYAFKNVKTETY